MTVLSGSISSRPVPVTLEKIDVSDATGALIEVREETAGKRIYLWGVIATLPADNPLTISSNATAILPPLTTTGLLIAPPSPIPAGAFPIAQTEAGEALNVQLNAAGQLSATFYVEIAD